MGQVSEYSEGDIKLLGLRGPKNEGLKPIPDYGDLYTIDAFAEMVETGAIIDDDGTGYYATATHISEQLVSLDTVRSEKIYTHVMWFNR